MHIIWRYCVVTQNARRAINKRSATVSFSCLFLINNENSEDSDYSSWWLSFSRRWLERMVSVERMLGHVRVSRPPVPTSDVQRTESNAGRHVLRRKHAGMVTVSSTAMRLAIGR